MTEHQRATFVGLIATMLSVPTGAMAQETKKPPPPAPERGFLDHLEADVHIGAMSTETRNFQASGDASLGYIDENWGVRGFIRAGSYDVIASDSRTEWTRLEGNGEGFWQSAKRGEPYRLEITLRAGGANFDTSYFPLNNSPAAGFFHDETSVMGRGSLLIGLQARPTQGLALRVRVGGGAQFESFSYLNLDPGDPSLISDTENLSARGLGLLDANWAFWEKTLTFRLFASASYFQVTRTNSAIARVDVSIASQTATATELDIRSQGNLDIDALEFFGFKPGIYGGLTYLRLSNDEGSTSVSIPTFGATIVKPSWFDWYLPRCYRDSNFPGAGLYLLEYGVFL